MCLSLTVLSLSLSPDVLKFPTRELVLRGSDGILKVNNITGVNFHGPCEFLYVKHGFH